MFFVFSTIYFLNSASDKYNKMIYIHLEWLTVHILYLKFSVNWEVNSTHSVNVNDFNLMHEANNKAAKIIIKLQKLERILAKGQLLNFLH